MKQKKIFFEFDFIKFFKDTLVVLKLKHSLVVLEFFMDLNITTVHFTGKNLWTYRQNWSRRPISWNSSENFHQKNKGKTFYNAHLGSTIAL